MIQVEIQEELNKMANFYKTNLSTPKAESFKQSLREAKKQLTEVNRSKLTREDLNKLLNFLGKLTVISETFFTLESNFSLMEERINQYLDQENPMKILILGEEISKKTKELCLEMASLDQEYLSRVSGQKKDLLDSIDFFKSKMEELLIIHEVQIDQIKSINEMINGGAIDN